MQCLKYTYKFMFTGLVDGDENENLAIGTWKYSIVISVLLSAHT